MRFYIAQNKYPAMNFRLQVIFKNSNSKIVQTKTYWVFKGEMDFIVSMYIMYASFRSY